MLRLVEKIGILVVLNSTSDLLGAVFVRHIELTPSKRCLDCLPSQQPGKVYFVEERVGLKMGLGGCGVISKGKVLGRHSLRYEI